jgi:hypothetical protein
MARENQQTCHSAVLSADAWFGYYRNFQETGLRQ